MKKILNKISDYYIIFCIYALIGWLYEVLWMWFVVPPHHFVNRGVLLGPFLPIYGFGMLILLLLLYRFMSKKHPINNPINMIISTSTLVTFIYTTIIEYTTTPKILSVTYYLHNYGLYLLLINIIIIVITYIIINKTTNKKIKNIDCTIVIVFLLIWIITTLIEYVSHYLIDTYSHKLLWDYTKDFLNINKRVNWDASRNFAIGGTFLLYIIQPFINKLLKVLKDNQKLLITIIIGIPMLLDFILRIIIKI